MYGDHHDRTRKDTSSTPADRRLAKLKRENDGLHAILESLLKDMQSAAGKDATVGRAWLIQHIKQTRTRLTENI